MCATTLSQVPYESAQVESASNLQKLSSAAAPLVPWYSTSNGSAASDTSDLYDDDPNAVDLEVNFESEADILGVETSGDELDRGRDFSEMSSSQLTERGISDDDEVGTRSECDDFGMFVDDVHHHQQHLLGGGLYARSGSELSWDESADLPSFAIGGRGIDGNIELNGLLQFSKG